MPQPRFKASQEDEPELRSKASELRLSLPNSASTSGTVLHKQKIFDYVEISTAGSKEAATDNLTASVEYGYITAYREVGLLHLSARSFLLSSPLLPMLLLSMIPE